MKYESLYKKFFKYPDEFHKIYQNLFECDSSIKLPFDIKGNPAFIIVNHEILMYIEDIQVLNSKIINKIRKELPDIAYDWLLTCSLIEEIRKTNEIENVVSTRKQIENILHGNETSQYIRFFGIVNKYHKLKKEGFIPLLNNNDIRKLYDEILLNDIVNDNIKDKPDGKIYRKDEVEIIYNGKVIHEGIMPEENIIHTMQKSLDILNDNTISLFIRIAIFHYMFGYIHPFYDGNGRISRFITTDYLSKNLDLLCALQVSNACLNNRKAYYEAFKITNDIRNKGDLTTFVIMFLKIYYKELDNLYEVISEHVGEYIYYLNILNNKDINDKERLIINLLLIKTLFDYEGLTMPKLCNILNMSDVTVRNYLKNGYLSELLKIKKDGKAYLYSLDLNKLL